MSISIGGDDVRTIFTNQIGNLFRVTCCLSALAQRYDDLIAAGLVSVEDRIPLANESRDLNDTAKYLIELFLAVTQIDVDTFKQEALDATNDVFGGHDGNPPTDDRPEDRDPA